MSSDLPRPAGAEPISTPEVEPERYELEECRPRAFALDRRQAFRVLGGGIAVALALQGDARAQESGRAGSRGDLPLDVAAWLHIDEAGAITVFTGKVEVGQNIRTSLTQAVCEELRVATDAIQLVMGDTGRVPYDRGTFGSRTTPIMASHLRKVAATARAALLDLAAERLKTAAATLRLGAGRVWHDASGRSYGFGELTSGRQLLRTVLEDEAIADPAHWAVSGTSTPKVGGIEFVTGRHLYPADVKLPDMLHGKVLRPTAFNATLKRLDVSVAEAMAGVTVVNDGDFVGVAAPTPSGAEAALAAIDAEWESAPQPDDRELFDYLRTRVLEEPQAGGFGRSRGDAAGSLEQGFENSEVLSEATYEIAYIQHVPLEPRAAVARWDEQGLTVHTGTQRPFGVRAELAEAFRLAEERVRVIMPDTGSGYGGKHTGEAAVEAARLARAAARPVRVVWTREEEFTWAYFRPAGVIDVKAAAAADGTLTAWEFHNYNSGSSAIETPYEVANRGVHFHRTDYPLRQGSYRGLAATANVFARETAMDELAVALGIDPLRLRLRNLRAGRLRDVLVAATDAFGWGARSRATRRGTGIGIGTEKGGYVACCAEVEVAATGHVRILRATQAFECGAIVNPTHLRSQVEGSLVQGIGGALFEAVRFADGRILNPRLSDYRIPRFSDVPELETVLVDRPDLPSAGAGEAPIVGIAPAVGNAIFDATGVRLRNLPLVPSGLPAET